jgi:hypothetical protein
MTTGDFSSTYSPIGIIMAKCKEGYKLKDGIEIPKPKNEQTQRDDLYSSTINGDKIKDYAFKECNIYELLDQMYSDAKDKGANGIIKIEIQNNNQSNITIIGMAIKY